MKNWKDKLGIEKIENTNIEQIEKVTYLIESLGEKNEFDEIETILYEFSNLSLVSTAVANNNCQLNFIKKIMRHQYTSDLNMFGERSKGEDILFNACLYGHKDIIKYLVEERSAMLTYGGISYLLESSANNKSETVKYLIERKAVTDIFLNTKMLQLAVKQANKGHDEDDVELVRILIDEFYLDVSIDDYRVVDSMYEHFELYKDILRDLFKSIHKIHVKR